ncbi:MAG TPA: hypothetical protein VFU65_03985 [Actinocrinis sp.]|nr:hypothetical protein [Actinocrinis sp.]
MQQTSTGRDDKPSVSAAESAASADCATKAKKSVTAHGAVYGEPDLVIAIDSESFSRSQTDPRVVAAFAAWSNCMKQSGYTYKTPNDPLHDPRWAGLPAASQLEIETAQADVRCKRATDVVGIWYAVESAMQQAAISQNTEEFATVKAGEARELKIAAAVLGGEVHAEQ